MNFSLRFPRCLKIRYDKDWNDAMDRAQLDQIIQNFNDARRLNKGRNKMVFQDSSEGEGSDDIDQIVPGKKH